METNPDKLIIPKSQVDRLLSLEEAEENVRKTDAARLEAEKEAGREFERELERRKQGLSATADSPEMQAANARAEEATNAAYRAEAELFFVNGGKAIPHEQTLQESFASDYYKMQKVSYRVARDIAEKYGAILDDTSKTSDT